MFMRRPGEIPAFCNPQNRGEATSKSAVEATKNRHKRNSPPSGRCEVCQRAGREILQPQSYFSIFTVAMADWLGSPVTRSWGAGTSSIKPSWP